MLRKFKNVQEQWGGSSDIIDHWLDKRQHVIVEYCKLAALQPCTTKAAVSELPSPQALLYFCQELVDYISEAISKSMTWSWISGTPPVLKRPMRSIKSTVKSSLPPNPAQF